MRLRYKSQIHLAVRQLFPANIIPCDDQVPAHYEETAEHWVGTTFSSRQVENGYKIESVYRIVRVYNRRFYVGELISAEVTRA